MGLIKQKKRLPGTFNLYNVKATKNEKTYYDIHILVTNTTEDQQAFENL